MPEGCSRRRFGQSVMLSLGGLAAAGCGTILYPERRGQPAGRLDWGVVALDGIGLILFFIPGVIAFAVDFMTGAIYLPPEGYGRLDANKPQRLTRIEVPKSRLTRQGIARIVSESTGQSVSLQPNTYTTRPIHRIDAFWDARNELAALTEEPASPSVLRSQSPAR